MCIRDRVSPVFKLTDGAGNKLDEIIIKNPHSVQEHYYDRNYNCLLYTSGKKDIYLIKKD